MNQREIIKLALAHQPVPYVPWSMSFTREALGKLIAHFGTSFWETLDNHIVVCGSDIGHFTPLGENMYRDRFGVVWDRSVDKDIGVVHGQVLSQPSLRGYEFPDPEDPLIYRQIPEILNRNPHRYRVFSIGFSLYERAWTLRGMEALMMDFYDHPDFVRKLLRTIADHNIAMIKCALKYDFDAVRFGDDWGQQHGLQMGYGLWREFIYPELKRMYGVVKEAGKAVFIHSCGDVDELFDDLIDIGLDCFNPFQPEVMDVFALLQTYHGRLAFHGGLSTQQTLPYGSIDDVRKECRKLLEAGRRGGYIFAPAHSVEGDVPLDNLLVMLETVLSQPR